jgi:hypothetical protein
MHLLLCTRFWHPCCVPTKLCFWSRGDELCRNRTSVILFLITYLTWFCSWFRVEVDVDVLDWIITFIYLNFPVWRLMSGVIRLFQESNIYGSSLWEVQVNAAQIPRRLYDLAWRRVPSQGRPKNAAGKFPSAKANSWLVKIEESWRAWRGSTSCAQIWCSPRGLTILKFQRPTTYFQKRKKRTYLRNRDAKILLVLLIRCTKRVSRLSSIATNWDESSAQKVRGVNRKSNRLDI